MQRKWVIFIAVLLGFLNFVCWREVFALAGPKYLLVDFLNVGQGDSAFIMTPEGHQIIIDGGPNYSALEDLQTLMPVWDRTIDLVVLTHPEADHMQGLLDILQKYKADYILWSGVARNTPDFNAWTATLENQKSLGAKIIIAKSGQEIKAGSAVFNTIYPMQDVSGKTIKNTSNDTCVVEKLIYGKQSFLFTGDISSTAEKEIVNSGENISSNVLKVAHHGSKYSTSELWLAAVSPMAAVIEVGKNSYGHPTLEVLQRLEKFGIKVFRTDTDGDIEMVSDGNTIKIK